MQRDLHPGKIEAKYGIKDGIVSFTSKLNKRERDKDTEEEEKRE